MAKYLTLVGLILGLAAGAAHAGPVLVTSSGALGATDSVNWSQLGGDGTIIPSSFSATSGGGLSISGGLGGSGCVAVVLGVNCSWGPPGPGFGAGDSLIWADDFGKPSGPLSLGFPSVFGAGLFIQADLPGLFAAQIKAFNGGTLLGTFSEFSDANGDGIFIGVLDTVKDITSIVLTLTGCGGVSDVCAFDDFAVNTLLLNTTGQVGKIPEPTSLSLLLLGAGGLAFFRRSRRAGRTDVTQEKTA